MDMNSSSHTKWECKYYIVFAPKYRRNANMCRKPDQDLLALAFGIRAVVRRF